MKADEFIAKREREIQELKNAIYDLHGCDSEYVGAHLVTEWYDGEIVWGGTVETFNLRGHPKAKRAYAWAHATGENDQGRRYVAVLELPPVNSPQTAVQAAIMSEIKDAKRKS